ncbi:anaphase-promoting complex subunit cdc27 [Sorochytrium milnesiophthora]
MVNDTVAAVTRPLAAAVTWALDNHDLVSATFLAERLLAEATTSSASNRGDRSLSRRHYYDAHYLLAKCHYLQSRHAAAYALLCACSAPVFGERRDHSINNDDNDGEDDAAEARRWPLSARWLFARTCVDMVQMQHRDAQDVLFQAERALTTLQEHVLWGSLSDTDTEASWVPQPDPSTVYSVLGDIYRLTARPAKAKACYRQAVEHNSFNWSAWQAFCELGEPPKAGQTVATIFSPLRISASIASVTGPETAGVAKSGAPVPPPPLPAAATVTHDDISEADIEDSNVLIDDINVDSDVSFTDASHFASAPQFSLDLTPDGEFFSTGAPLGLSSHRGTPVRHPATVVRKPETSFASMTASSSSIAMSESDTEGNDSFHLDQSHIQTVTRARTFKPIPFKLGAMAKEHKPARSKLGRAYYEERILDRSQRHFDTARRLDPFRTDDMDIYSTALWYSSSESQLSALAHDLLEQSGAGESPSSDAKYGRAAPEAWIAMGNFCSLTKDSENALKHFCRAVQISPRNDYAMVLCGHEHVAADQIDQGMEQYRRALQVNPRSYVAWHGLGVALFKREKYNQAEYHFRRACSIKCNSIMVFYVGQMFHRRGEYAQAVEYYSEALRLDSDNATAMLHKATCLAHMKRYDEAVPLLHQLCRLKPEEMNAYSMLGWIHYHRQQYPQALEYFSQAMACGARTAGYRIPSSLKDIVHKVVSKSQLPTLSQLLGEDLRTTAVGLTVHRDE